MNNIRTPHTIAIGTADVIAVFVCDMLAIIYKNFFGKSRTTSRTDRYQLRAAYSRSRWLCDVKVHK